MADKLGITLLPLEKTVLKVFIDGVVLGVPVMNVLSCVIHDVIGM